MSTVTEIEGAIAKLTPEEQREIARWLEERLMEDESPEMLAVIDEGIRSLREKPSVPLEEVRRKISGWATKSS